MNVDKLPVLQKQIAISSDLCLLVAEHAVRAGYKDLALAYIDVAYAMFDIAGATHPVCNNKSYQPVSAAAG